MVKSRNILHDKSLGRLAMHYQGHSDVILICLVKSIFISMKLGSVTSFSRTKNLQKYVKAYTTVQVFGGISLHDWPPTSDIMVNKTLLARINYLLFTQSKYISHVFLILTLLHSERPKLYIFLAFLSAIGLNSHNHSLTSFQILSDELAHLP